MKHKPGVKSKSKSIEDNFNPQKIGNDKEDELAARQQQLLNGADTTDDLEKLKETLGPEGSMLAQMLIDMRWVYRMVNGRQRLLDLVKDSDKEFVKMVQEMMKLESTLLGTKKNVDPTAGNAVFVVLKGLQAKEVELATVEGVDIKQIANALDPTRESDPDA